MFYFCICSHVKLPAVTKAVNRVTAKSQSKDSDLKLVEEETVEQKSVVCKRRERKGSRGRGHKTQPKKTATKTKDEEVKPNTKQISIKDVSVMIKELSQEELSPQKEIGDDLEIKEETEEKAVEEHVQETETKPKMHKQTARRGVRLHPAKRNLDRKTLQEMKRVENIEEPEDSGRSIVLRNDYEVDLSQSSYEEWLKDNNLAGASSDKENIDSDFVIGIDTRNGEIHKKRRSVRCNSLQHSQFNE